MRMTRRRTTVVVLVLGLLAALPGTAFADHPAPGATSAFGPASTNANQGGQDGVSFEILASFPAGNSFTDHEFFSQDGEIFAAVGTLGGGGVNLAGQTIVKITEGGPPSTGGAIDPSFVSAFPSATCVTDASGALGLQHDVEAAPKGITILNEVNPFADASDTQLILDATDAPGRCHDQGVLGFVGPPQGGLEIVDVTDPAAPVELALTSHIGESHTVNVDPKRPHIAYVVTSDAVTTSIDVNDCDGDGDVEERIRENECAGDTDTSDLDGFEIVDYSSCMDLPEGMSVEDKREACQPEVFRYRYPTIDMSLGHTNLGTVYGCHELEIYPDDRMTCGSGATMIVLDMAGAFDDNGTPTDFSDDTVNGEALPCQARASTTEGPTATGATVYDCVTGGTAEAPVALDVATWIADGAPSVEGVRWLGSAYHMGRESATGAASPAFGAAEDIDFNHEAEFTHSGNFVLATDERGGGVLPPGATCNQGVDNPTGNGGIHAYATDRLTTDRPETAEAAFDAYGLTSEGEKAIYRASVQTGSEVAFCTAHVFHQIPGQNRIFMAWYSQGTRVVDYVENPDGTIDFIEVAYFIPENTDQWASEVFDFEENEDGSFTYYGLSAETLEGRGTIDIFSATLPRPAQLADEVFTLDRIEGSGAVDTAVAVSQDAFPGGSDAVVLGRADVYADNLAGGPLAAKVSAPLLYTATTQLDPATAAEIQRLGATEVFVLGGEAAISPAVEAELVQLGLTVTRFAGANRFETAALVAEEVGSATGTAYVVEGENADSARGWPDPVSVAPLAGFQGDPVLLVNRDRLPQETVDAIASLGIDDVVIAGGTAAVSQPVADAIDAQVSDVSRLAGATRYETSLAVYQAQIAAGMSPATLTLATGRDWPQALAAGPVSAMDGTAFAVIDGQGGADTLSQLLAANEDAVTRVRLIGDTAAISAEVEAQILDRFAPEPPVMDEETQTAGVVPPMGTDALLLLGGAALLATAALRRRRTV